MLGTEGASGSRFLSSAGRVQGLRRKVLPGPGSYPLEGFRVWDGMRFWFNVLNPRWKGLVFGVEGASGSRF